VSFYNIVTREWDQGESGWALERVPEMGNVNCANWVCLMPQDDLRVSLLNIAKFVSARQTDFTSLNRLGTGSNLGRRNKNGQ